MSVSVTFHLMYVHIVLVRSRLLSGHLFGKELSARLTICSLYIMSINFVILVISRFDFEGIIWVLIAPVPVHCLRVSPFKHRF